MMGRIPENLGQRIVELARIAAAMQLEMESELSSFNCDVADRRQVAGNREIKGWDGGSLDTELDRQWTRSGGAPLGDVMEDTLSSQVDRAAWLFPRPARLALPARHSFQPQNPSAMQPEFSSTQPELSAMQPRSAWFLLSDEFSFEEDDSTAEGAD